MFANVTPISFHAIAALAITVIALVLFSRDRIPLATSCVFVLSVLCMLFTVLPYENGGVRLEPSVFFTGFGHEALIAICALMMLGRGIEITGALHPLAMSLAKLWRRAPSLTLLLALITSAFLSAFVNNTPIVVLMLPVLINVALKTNTRISSFLMPIGLVTLIGGMATTIGTSTNLLVVGIAHDLGLTTFNMFYFTLPAVIAGGVGILYLWLVAPRLLPLREGVMPDTSPRVFNALLHVRENSHIVGKTLLDVESITDHHIKIENILRGEGLYVPRHAHTVIQAGDKLLVSDTPKRLKEYENQLKAKLYNIDAGSATMVNYDPQLGEPQKLAEVVIIRGSTLHHTTLNDSQFYARFKLLPLAIHRAKTQVVSGLGIEHVYLRSGDILLVQGTAADISALKQNSDLVVLDGRTELPQRNHAKRALAIMGMVVALAALNLVPIAVSALLGVLLMLLTRVLDWRTASSALSASIIMVIATSIALGIALIETGGTVFIAQVFIAMMGDASPHMVLAALMLLMALITNVVSNSAAAVIGTPIGFYIAAQLGVSPEPFVLAVLFGANMSFATPIGYQTNLLIYNTGGYKFSDFVKVGLPLILIMWLSLSWLIPIFFPFY